jgi:hypothetical protein
MGQVLQLPWMPLRGIISTADSDLTASTKTWATFVSTYHPSQPTSGVAKLIPAGIKHISICFDHKNADTDTAAVSIYVYKQGGPAEFVCSIDTITAGEQQSDLGNPAATRYFCDTIGSITQRFIAYPNPTGVTGVIETDSSGSNGVAKLDFDTYDYKFILCLFTAISSSDDVRAFFTGTP